MRLSSVPQKTLKCLTSSRYVKPPSATPRAGRSPVPSRIPAAPGSRSTTSTHHASAGHDARNRAGQTEAVQELPRLLEHGSLEERKEFIRAFVAGVTIVPEAARIDLRIRQLPAVWPENSSVGVVAGARFEA
ncbi:MAG: hypothetical protein V3T74_03790, partial [Gemmatimonadales bacterium]